MTAPATGPDQHCHSAVHGASVAGSPCRPAGARAPAIEVGRVPWPRPPHRRRTPDHRRPGGNGSTRSCGSGCWSAIAARHRRSGSSRPASPSSSSGFADAFIQLIKTVTGAGHLRHRRRRHRLARQPRRARAGWRCGRSATSSSLTVIALALGLLAGNLSQPGAGFHGQPAHAQTDAAKAEIGEAGGQEPGLVGVHHRTTCCPTSFLQPFVDNKILQVLVLAILTAGVDLLLPTRMREKRRRRRSRSSPRSSSAIIRIIMWAAPLGAFGGMAYTVAAVRLRRRSRTSAC